jgi:hypothetical protein
VELFGYTKCEVVDEEILLEAQLEENETLEADAHDALKTDPLIEKNLLKSVMVDL